MVSIIPHVKDLEPVTSWVPTDEEQERGLRIHPRIDAMLEARSPYEDSMLRSLLLYSGKSRPNPRDPRKERVVVPMARIFVESKTAEEVKSMRTYEFGAGKDPSDEWKLSLIKDVDAHVRRRVKLGPKRMQAIRMKNICGVSILRLGYRKLMRTIKEYTDVDEDGEGITWKLREVPVYDDLFVDLVSPLNFAVDPNATTMDDAMDCVHFHTENWEVAYETYAKDKRFKNWKHVRPGHNNCVDFGEYFCKQRDEWVIFASPSSAIKQTKWHIANTPRIEIYCGPLPDAHKELPFVSYHNNATFVSGYMRDMATQSPSGEEVGQSEDVRAEEGFWTEGDPQTMMDLIDLRTGFGRAAYKAMKRASAYIVATAPGHAFDDSRPWKDGDQAPGMMGKFSVESLGEANIASFQFIYDDLMNQMILTSGTDPRNLTDNKQKTATESIAQTETSQRRLEAGMEYNEENGEVRMGTILYKLTQQRYSKPELVPLTGAEDEEDLKDFDEVENDPDTGKPFVGKRLRRVESSVRVRERKRKKRDGTYKYYLTKSEEGAKSFLARPEYIRSSDLRVVVSTGRRAGELRAVKFQQAKEALELAVSLYQLAMPQAPGLVPPVTVDDLPNMKKLVKNFVEALGLNPETDIGQSGGKEEDVEEQQQKESMAEYEMARVDIGDVDTQPVQ